MAEYRALLALKYPAIGLVCPSCLLSLEAISECLQLVFFPKSIELTSLHPQFKSEKLGTANTRGLPAQNQ